MPYRFIRDSALLWKISRPVNLLIAACVICESLWLTAGKNMFPFSEPLTWLLIFIIIVVMAAGYWVNDLFDYRIDLVNKPRKTFISVFISSKKVWTAWFLAWIFVLLCGLLFPLRIQLIFQGTWILLFLYARYFKRMPVIGNLVIASLGAGLILTASAWLYILTFSTLSLAIFSFEITLIREITKDIEDLKGDIRYKLKTLPILIGIRSSKNVLLSLYIIFILSCWMPVLVDYFLFHKINIIFICLLLMLVLMPAIYLVFLLRKASVSGNFGKMSHWLKVLMLGGMLTLAFF